MLKLICTFMVLIITLAILSSNNVESRTVLANSDGISPSQLHYVRFGKGQMSSDSSNEDERGEFITKRKSELLSSLYGLPYALVNKRNAN